MRNIAVLFTLLLLSLSVRAQNVTVSATARPASEVFRTLMTQTGKNFVYSSDVLKDVRVTVHAKNKPLKKVLAEMFDGKGIDFAIRENEVILKRAPKARKTDSTRKFTPEKADAEEPEMLPEVVVVSRLEAPQTESAEIGAKKLTPAEIMNATTVLGEPDVIKAIQSQPGVSEGAEGLAGMYVHGGNADENLYMLDNVPLYQINHLAGLFSAFNTDAIRYIDFYKSSVPAKYDGRLSSFLDVQTKNGSPDGHHGSFRLGMTAMGFNLDGPISRRTTYSVALRRSWSDLVTTPIIALSNSKNDDEHIRFNYHFTDLNAKVTHRINDRTTAFASIYFGDDYLKTGVRDKIPENNHDSDEWYNDEKYVFLWGNFLVRTGLGHKFSDRLSAEFTAAYTRFFTFMKNDLRYYHVYADTIESSRDYSRYRNRINDWIFKADFHLVQNENTSLRFGTGYTRHSFLPGNAVKLYEKEGAAWEGRDSTRAYGANEVNAYFEGFVSTGEHWRVNAGLHASLFNIDSRVKNGLSPRLSASYRPNGHFAFKGAYSRTVQYVHQLTQSYLALPTDQWIPVTGKFKPQTADKISAGAYWQNLAGNYTVSAEAYMKWMHNLVDYRDEYYLRPPLEMWDARLTSGRGTAKGIDLKFEKLSGKFTGHIAYSLAWADRTFREKNLGHTFPARFDNRHTVHILLNWNISSKVSLNAAWTGHSGNRFTLLTQVWESPQFPGFYQETGVPMRAPINNYRLPFYHRLDLSFTFRNRRGYWNVGLYNAYCHRNVVAVDRDYDDNGQPVFRKVKFLPIIPSISYTWQF